MEMCILTLAGTETRAVNPDGGVMDAVVILHATGRAVGAVVAAAQENWLQHRAFLTPAPHKYKFSGLTR